MLRVPPAPVVLLKCAFEDIPIGGVAAGSVAIERKGAHRGVVFAGGIIDKRGCSIGRVVGTGGVQQERRSAGGRIVSLLCWK